MRYIEMNPVRAGMVDHPAKYRWSSYAANALGVGNAVLTPQAEYVALGRLPVDRQPVYRGLFDREADSDELALLRCALQTGTPLGNEKFKAEIEATLDLKVGFARRGRPLKMSRSIRTNNRECPTARTILLQLYLSFTSPSSLSDEESKRIVVKGLKGLPFNYVILGMPLPRAVFAGLRTT